MLSVVATQLKTVLGSVVRLSVSRQPGADVPGAGRFLVARQVGSSEFMSDTISLIPTRGFFITVNPGYADPGYARGLRRPHGAARELGRRSSAPAP